MAVCIPDMKMPKNCYRCPLRTYRLDFADGNPDPETRSLELVGTCRITGSVINMDFDIRSGNCPLRECPHSVKEKETSNES